jgi:hypothetical protein
MEACQAATERSATSTTKGLLGNGAVTPTEHSDSLAPTDAAGTA